MGDVDWLRHTIHGLGWLMAGEIKMFRLAELEAVRGWVASMPPDQERMYWRPPVSRTHAGTRSDTGGLGGTPRAHGQSFALCHGVAPAGGAPASGLRTCPLCRSAAIRAIRRTGLDGSDTRVALQCAECEAWRARDLGPRAVRALDRRLCHDIENMARLLGPDFDGPGVEQPEAERWRP